MHTLEILQKDIEALWQLKDNLSRDPSSAAEKTVRDVITLLDQGKIRVASKENGQWIIHQWIKQAILLAFKVFPKIFFRTEGYTFGYDTFPSKLASWSAEDFEKAAIRALPGCQVRFGAYIAPQCVLTPSFVNVGAYVGKGTMVDTWATVGSCAQIGQNVHLSGGAGIGGVLEPLQANPVIIEDNCFIGARSEIVEGVVVEEGSVLALGTFIGASTKIVDRTTGEVFRGRVPAYSVVVPGSLPSQASDKTPEGLHLNCAVIVKRVDAQTRAKTSVNELLRA